MDRIIFPIIPKMEQDIQRLRGELELAHDAIKAIWKAQMASNETLPAEPTASSEEMLSLEPLSTSVSCAHKLARHNLVSRSIAEAVKLLPRDRSPASHIYAHKVDEKLERYRELDRLDEIEH